MVASVAARERGIERFVAEVLPDNQRMIQTFRDAGLIAQEVGAAAIALHGRTVVQHYSGQARWQAITSI